MPRVAFDGFTVTLPEGWSDVLEDATYSDPDQLPPLTFEGPARVGQLFISTPLFDRDDQPGATPGDAETLAAGWARRRGLGAPVSAAKDSDAHGGFATAIHRLGDDYVQIWFITNGRAVLQSSYVCPWDHHDVEREVREGIVASLRFA